MRLLPWLKRNNGISLQQAIEKCIQAKIQSNRRKRYVKSLSQYLKQFSRGRESKPLRDVANIRTLERWFTERNEAPATRAANIGRLSSLFAYAHRRGWINENPCFRLERVTIERHSPKVLTPEQAKELVDFCITKKPVALAFLALTLFAGIRPEETRGVTWADVNDDCVIISASASKVRRRRIVHLEPIAKQLLRKARKLGSTLPVSRTTHKRYIHAFRSAIGLERWPQDFTRHSCASYWLSLKQDDAFVAMQLGSSVSMLHRHYKELVPRSEAERFFALDVS